MTLPTAVMPLLYSCARSELPRTRRAHWHAPCATDLGALRECLVSATSQLLRVKGIVKDAQGGAHLVQAVGSRVTVTAVPDDARPGLVGIGLAGQVHLGPLDALLGEAAHVDQPDAQPAT